jgi:hypothetical protein
LEISSAVVVALRGPRLKPFFGVFERLFDLASIAYIFVITIQLARIRPTGGRHG